MRVGAQPNGVRIGQPDIANVDETVVLVTDPKAEPIEVEVQLIRGDFDADTWYSVELLRADASSSCRRRSPVAGDPCDACCAESE